MSKKKLKAGLLISSLCVAMCGSAWAAPVYCTGHDQCKTNWDIKTGETIQVDVKAKAGNNPEQSIPASRPAESNFLGYTCVSNPVVCGVRASDRDDHMCQMVVTGKVFNYILNSNLTAQVTQENGSGVGTIDLVSAQAGDVAQRVWSGQWVIPDSAAGKRLTLQYQGTVADKPCPSHPSSDDRNLDLSAYRASFTVLDMGALTLTDTSNTANKVHDSTDDDATPTNGVLYVGQDTSGVARVTMDLSWLPADSAAGFKFRWELEEKEKNGKWGKASHWSTNAGDFMTQPVTLTWTDPKAKKKEPSREFRVRAWLDCNTNKKLDDGEHRRLLGISVLSLDLNIWNGGSDLDNGQTAGSQGSQVPDPDEESVGAYLLVNWDDDDADGVMNNDGTWSTLPVPDLTENSVANEDNLAQLKPTVQPLLDTGTIELEVSGTDAAKVKLWTQSTKGTQITLTSNKKTWNLANSTEKTDFQNFMNDGYWIEGADVGTAERGVTFTLRYKDSGGTEVCNDICRATVVMINLANAVYRDNMIDLWGIGQNSRGHAALVWRYAGTCTKTDLTNDTNFILIEMGGPTDNRNLTTITHQTGYPAYGCFRNPSLTYVQRLQIIRAARALAARAPITYTAVNAVDPDDWNGHLDTITGLRCDALVEVCYEINGVEVWGMERDPDNHTVHYGIDDQTDNWSYNAILGTWSAGANNHPDNLEEHNDFDLVGWADTFMPATQCGNVAPVEANTRFARQNLCQPIGSTGGN